MGHPRWPGFDTKTGDPQYDNHSMRLNRRLWRDTQQHLRFRARNRKRKKHITRVEGGNYIKAVVAAMNMLHHRDQQKKATADD